MGKNLHAIKAQGNQHHARSSERTEGIVASLE